MMKLTLLMLVLAAAVALTRLYVNKQPQTELEPTRAYQSDKACQEINNRCLPERRAPRATGDNRPIRSAGARSPMATRA